MTGLTKLENFFVKTSISSFIVRFVRLSQKFCFSLNFSQFCKSCRNLVLIAFCVVLFPPTSHAQVLLSEIAWMGTDADANNEWIEIYNFNTTPTDLTGWTLTSSDGSIGITLSGTLLPHAVGVLERTDDTTLPGVTALLTYTGALANGGTTLTLKDENGVVSDQAIGGSDWEAVGGSNEIPKKTPQRTRTGTWITAGPTPGAENSETNEVVTQTETSTNAETKTTTQETSSRGGGSSPKIGTAKKITEIINPELTLAFTVPRTVYVNEEIAFEAEPSGLGKTIMDSLQYTWNFGDTYTGKGRKVSHTFSHPGVYTVVLQGTYAKHNEMIRHDVTVLPVDFEISRTPHGDAVVHNKSSEEIDLGGFAFGLEKRFIFPQYTFVKSGGSLTVPKERIHKVFGLLSLLDTRGVVVAYEKVVVPQGVEHTGVVFSKPTAQTLVQEGSVISASQEVHAQPDTNGALVLPAPGTETVIRIGTDDTAEPQGGFVTRMFRKFTNLFQF